MNHTRRLTSLIAVFCFVTCLTVPAAAEITPIAQTENSVDAKPVRLIKTTVTYREVDGHKILADVSHDQSVQMGDFLLTISESRK